MDDLKVSRPTERKDSVMTPVLYMVIPCYNEEEVLPETSRRLNEKYDALIASGGISPDSRIVFVNDGSKDRPGK